MQLPKGVSITSLTKNQDARGELTEIFRKEWFEDLAPIQWNYVISQENTFRGFHVHLKHADYLTVLTGSMYLGLKDMRKNSPTFNFSTLIHLKSSIPQAVTIPPGVGHGFCFTENTSYIYSVTDYWKKEDEFGCIWNDADLKINWPLKKPILSEKDTNAMSYQHLFQQITKKLL